MEHETLFEISRETETTNTLFLYASFLYGVRLSVVDILAININRIYNHSII